MERRRALLDWAARSGAWIVEDDYQSEFVYEGRVHAPLASLERNGRVLHVGTFTNAVFPSLRLAYVVLPPQLVDVFAAVRGQLDDHTHGLAQAVLADFLDAGHFAAHLRRMRGVYEAQARCARPGLRARSAFGYAARSRGCGHERHAAVVPTRIRSGGRRRRVATRRPRVAVVAIRVTHARMARPAAGLCGARRSFDPRRRVASCARARQPVSAA